ncbi:hypothetical protein QFZ20_000763 [Flavobacterium sp. W4I14]|nr:hypothetical protein [Flavobacterium sp. W4I14]
MRYHLYILFTMLIIGCINGAYATVKKNMLLSTHILQQDTLNTARQQEKRAVEHNKKETLTQTEKSLKNVPKAKNKVIPRTIGPTSLNIKSPGINQVKVRVNTQVKIKL